MRKNIQETKGLLVEHGLKVTPQRIAVLDSILKLTNHPTADNIIERVHRDNPNIASGTVYKVLETFVNHGLVRRVKTDRDVMHYDGVMSHHHHLYCSECNKISDYSDDKLDKMLQNYFSRKKIPGFIITDIRLQINGQFEDGHHKK